MTAEIALMNKSAVALAADSAVTIETSSGPKVYNSINKLFALSKHQPVGIMMYGGADFMEVPWELIIKMYRDELGERAFPRLDDYAENLLRFIGGNKQLFSIKRQNEHIKHLIQRSLRHIYDGISTRIELFIEENNGNISDAEAQSLVAAGVADHHVHFKGQGHPPLRGIPVSHRAIVRKKYGAILRKSVHDLFGPLSKDKVAMLEATVLNMICRDHFPDETSGIVVAGFGQKDFFPALVSIKTDAVIAGRFKYKIDKRLSVEFDNDAIISPFAQDQMVRPFIEGVDMDYLTTNNIATERAFTTFAEEVKKYVTPKQLSILKKTGREISSELERQLREHRRAAFVDPVLDAVAFLPKEELAAMAESLINLTSFKLKVSLDAETVGGPIDVALISKGDGLVWIKRKHYFKPELNPAFMQNYMKTGVSNQRRGR